MEGNINQKLIHFWRALGGRNNIIDDTNGFDCNKNDSSILLLNGTKTTNNRTKRPTTQFVYNGCLYSVQQNFEFPNLITLKKGLLHWFCGSPTKFVGQMSVRIVI